MTRRFLLKGAIAIGLSALLPEGRVSPPPISPILAKQQTTDLQPAAPIMELAQPTAVELEPQVANFQRFQELLSENCKKDGKERFFQDLGNLSRSPATLGEVYNYKMRTGLESDNYPPEQMTYEEHLFNLDRRGEFGNNSDIRIKITRNSQGNILRSFVNYSLDQNDQFRKKSEKPSPIPVEELIDMSIRNVPTSPNNWKEVTRPTLAMTGPISTRSTVEGKKADIKGDVWIDTYGTVTIATDYDYLT